MKKILASAVGVLVPLFMIVLMVPFMLISWMSEFAETDEEFFERAYSRFHSRKI